MFVMDEDGKKMSGPAARKALLFQRAVVNSRRREQPALRGTDAAHPNSQKMSGVKAQRQRIKAAFDGADAA